LKRRLVISTEIIAPYRIPVFNALAARSEIDLHVIFLAETDPGLRKWQVYREEIGFSYQVLKSYRCRVGRFNLLLTRGMGEALRSSSPEIILGGGYSYLAMWEAQRWARRHKIPFLLWSESNSKDARRNFPWVESAKRKFVQSCDGCVVPGRSPAEYLGTFGVAPEKIWVAPNAVDHERFSSGATRSRGDPATRNMLGLPQRYLLYVGRFVRSKGVFDLLTAYGRLPDGIRREVGLVLAGDGEESDELLRRSREIEPGVVSFPGFLQRDELPAFYALAEALIFPTHSDPWGLVVNEAIACGLPVIATDVAGCVADLVRDGENGRVIRAGDPEGLAQAMEGILQSGSLRKKMGDASYTISLNFTPEIWAQGVVGAACSTLRGDRG
jgi:glycosyltransferase involved in cell wall biosynthesis